MARFIFITGGARSGKSDYALQLAERLPGPHYFLATCPVVDGEMEDRIARHKKDRQEGLWLTIEEELHVAGAIASLAAGSVCLLDCLTLWVNNLMYHGDLKGVEVSENDIADYCHELLRTVKDYNGTFICVSNEVGMGVVPDNAAARKYRDYVGRCNRIMATAASEVVLVSCGLPLFLKKQD